MTDRPSITVLPDGSRVHRSALSEPKDSPEAIRLARSAAWAGGSGMPPLPVTADGEVVAPENAADAQRIEAGWHQRYMWSRPGGASKIPPPNPLEPLRGDRRPAVTERMVADEMNRLIAERGHPFGYAATQALRRDAVAACAAKVHEAELKGGKVQGWTDAKGLMAGFHRSGTCRAMDLGVRRRAAVS